jgi:hypothetical protein
VKTFKIPASVRLNALRGLALRKKYRRGGTIVGISMARLLARGGSVPFAIVKKVSQYFPRHQFDNLHIKDSNGWIAWQLWGGSAGWSWSKNIVSSEG